MGERRAAGRRFRLGARPEALNVGSEPDPRFSFANERTLLAWHRTAVALMALGIGVTSLLPPVAITGGRLLIGVPLIALSAVLPVASYRQWLRNERAMRLHEPLPHSRLGLLLAAMIAVTGILAAIIVAA